MHSSPTLNDAYSTNVRLKLFYIIYKYPTRWVFTLIFSINKTFDIGQRKIFFGFDSDRFKTNQ